MSLTNVSHPLAYAVYFDHRRRNDPEFRKSLRREARRQERAIKEQADAHDARQKDAIKAAMAKAKDQGFPTNDEDKEAFFMGELQRGETMCTDGMLLKSLPVTCCCTTAC